MKKHIPNFLTCLNLVFGTLGCISMANGELDLGIMYVGISAVFDFLDGFAARMLNVRSEIGKQLDSLADMVSFGVLPSIFMVNYIFQLQPGVGSTPLYRSINSSVLSHPTCHFQSRRITIIFF